MATTNWTHDELVIAFGLYCKIPFGKIHIRNPDVIALANALRRTPSAVSWKLANFARLDPSLRQRNISGATHGGKLEQQVWEEFNGDWNRLAFESERLLANLSGMSVGEPVSTLPSGINRAATVMVRVNQSFFRSAVLAAYDGHCCVSGLSIPALLNASHIVPWRIDESNRTNPCNGLCLNAILDRAFDCGMMTVTPEYRVRVSSRLLKTENDLVLKGVLCRYHNQPFTDRYYLRTYQAVPDEQRKFCQARSIFLHSRQVRILYSEAEIGLTCNGFQTLPRPEDHQVGHLPLCLCGAASSRVSRALCGQPEARAAAHPLRKH